MSKSPRIYLAGPEVFLPDALAVGAEKARICATHGLEGVFPLDASLDLAGLTKLEQARKISLTNEGLMRSCDAIVANLTPFRGVSMDAGAVTRLTMDDVDSLTEKIPEIREVSPSVTGRGQVTYTDRNWSTQVMGVAPSYEKMRASEPTSGRFFTEEENAKRSLVALVGMTVVRQVFGDQPGSSDSAARSVKV